MDFKQAYMALDDTKRQFAAGKVSAWEHSHQRATALVAAVTAMAADMGVRLQQPMQIDGNGELRIVSLHESGRPANMGAGPFSEEFCAALNRHRPRTGVAPGTLCPDNGWCMLNHFEAEKMVYEHLLQVEKMFLFEASNGVPYMARLVETGDRYGRDGSLTHEGAEFGPTVEFYDLRHEDADWLPVRGAFISSYYTQTFCEGEGGVMLQKGDQQDWMLDAQDKAKVKDWIEQTLGAQPAARPKVSRPAPSVGM